MDGGDNTRLTIRRTINAPIDRVYRAWTDPAALRQWFGPSDGHECVLAEADLRVGGAYRLAMKTPSGDEHRVSGVYREIDAGRKLVFSWIWASDPETETLVTVELRRLDEGTELLLTHELFADADVRDLHLGGWTGCIDSFVRFTESPPEAGGAG